MILETFHLVAVYMALSPSFSIIVLLLSPFCVSVPVIFLPPIKKEIPENQIFSGISFFSFVFL